MQVPIERLMATEFIAPEKLEKEKQNIREATETRRGKRAPFSVVERGDGTWSVLDGNDALAALKEAGAQNVQVEVHKPYQKSVTDIGGKPCLRYGRRNCRGASEAERRRPRHPH